ncbi:recombinase RecF [Vibrio cholerae]|nr:recombinase RecF [Vibrio cholerae]
MTETNLTIRNLRISNFKGYRQHQPDKPIELDLDDADLILVTGKNGVGKTSILQALDCCLNQGFVPFKFLTEKQTSGSVCVNGVEHPLKKELYQEHGIASVSTFFFQENIARLACSEVIELLEPENKPGLIIRNGLQNLLKQIETWQLQLQRKTYRKDYEAERKKLAQGITEWALKLPDDFPAKKSLLQSTLTLKGGNLQSKWQSQLRNLSAALSKVHGLPEVVGESTPIHLDHIATCLKELNIQYINSRLDKDKPQEKYQLLLSRLQQFSPSIKAYWHEESDSYHDIFDTESGTKEFAPEMLIVGINQSYYDGQLQSKKDLQEDLRAQYKNVQLSLESLNEITSIEAWLQTFRSNTENWLRAFDGDDDSEKFIEITQSIAAEADVLLAIANGRQHPLLGIRASIESAGKQISIEIQQLVLAKSLAETLQSFSDELLPIFGGKTFSINELNTHITSKIPEPQKKSISVSAPDFVLQLVGTFFSWSKLEIDYELDRQNTLQTDAIGQAKEMLASAHKICKQESGARSQLLSLMGEIPAVELQNLTATMNSLLDKFHFPKDFLPINLEKIGTDKKPEWTFITNSGVKFNDLSTGQKTQLAICWTINLNLALTDTLKHRVIGFDDFTTSLDMNQLIPAAVLLRKMAYAMPSDKAKRQVIVTSHHEDLTNRLLDLLLPPNGYKMRVIQFEDWSPTTGPKFRVLKVDLGDQESAPEKIKLAVKRAFSPQSHMDVM